MLPTDRDATDSCLGQLFPLIVIAITDEVI